MVKMGGKDEKYQQPTQKSYSLPHKNLSYATDTILDAL